MKVERAIVFVGLECDQVYQTLASLFEDQAVLILARDVAEKILLQDKFLNNSESLKAELERHYQKLIGSEILT